MLYTVKNDYLTITADTFGAELHSIKGGEIEYLWQCGDSWKRYAPVLFPFICSPTGKKYYAKGKEYTMPANHGFARDSEFEFLKQTDNSVSFVLKSNEDTLKVYPYKFSLKITYTLLDNGVITSYTVENKDNKKIQIKYHDRNGEITERIIEPYLILFKQIFVMFYFKY